MTSLLVAGLTGSGKTSTTKLVADRLGYRWISGSDARRRFFGLEDAERGVSRLSQALSAPNLHLESVRMSSVTGESDFDAELLRLVRSMPDSVFDAWFLPWLIGDYPVVRALLRASPETRAHRIAHMMSISRAEAAAIISEKDARARLYALKQYGVDIERDCAPFCTVLETDNLATPEVVNQLADLVGGQ
jgi:cytidylate kinase